MSIAVTRSTLDIDHLPRMSSRAATSRRFANGDGFVTVHPCGATRPTTSNLNYTAGQTIPNAVVAKLGTSGKVCLYASSTTDLIADVNGYFA
ncbi:MAG: hypothetical protein JWN62_1822 [Acidimicrobiales bacterium]|nr:hypothetical protein [Acidimicrobiales bacterium]